MALGRAEVARYGVEVTEGRARSRPSAPTRLAVALEDGRTVARPAAPRHDRPRRRPARDPGCASGGATRSCTAPTATDSRSGTSRSACSSQREGHPRRAAVPAADTGRDDVPARGPRPTDDRSKGCGPAASSWSRATSNPWWSRTITSPASPPRRRPDRGLPSRRRHATFAARAGVLGLPRPGGHRPPVGAWAHTSRSDGTGATAVPGVWVAGNVTDPLAQVGASAAAEALAGAGHNLTSSPRTCSSPFSLPPDGSGLTTGH